MNARNQKKDRKKKKRKDNRRWNRNLTCSKIFSREAKKKKKFNASLQLSNYSIHPVNDSLS